MWRRGGGPFDRFVPRRAGTLLVPIAVLLPVRLTRRQLVTSHHYRASCTQRLLAFGTAGIRAIGGDG